MECDDEVPCHQQYDPQKDKRFNGTVKLPTIPRPKLKICMLGDAKHCEEAQGVGIDHMDVEALKKLNKNKKAGGAPGSVMAA